VVADYMARLGDFADDLWPEFDVGADEEKRGVDAVFGQDFEEIVGVRVVGTIIVGES